MMTILCSIACPRRGVQTARAVAVGLGVLCAWAAVANAIPAHMWSHRYAQPDGQWFEKVAVDPSGNIVVCGNFYASLSLGQVYTSAGFEDGFVAKFSASGNLLWVHQLGDVRPDRMMDIAVDRAGNVIVSGHMSSNINDADAVVAKYAPDGTLSWLKRFGANDFHFQSAMVVATNASNEIIIAGEFDGDFSVGGSTLQPTGGITFFMAKLDENGNHVWSERFATTAPYSYSLDGLGTLPDGHIILCGQLLDSVDFGNGALSVNGQSDIFLARFDTDGTATWSQRYGDAGAQQATDIAINDAGDIAMVGFTNGAIDFGGGELMAGADFDPFAAVLTASGNYVWSKIYNGASNQYPGSLAWAYNHDLLVVWRGSGVLNFGGADLSIVGPESGLWLTRLSGDSGAHRWSTTLTSSTNMNAQIQQFENRIILAGGVGGTVNFGAGQTTGEADYYDLFLVKFRDISTSVKTTEFTQLGQNVPNPFNPTTVIPYNLAASVHVRVSIYAASGALVTSLDEGVQPAGTHVVTWNGRNARGQAVASGVYFYRLEGSADAPRKMVLLK